MVFDMAFDMGFDMVFDTVFDMTVWFGGRGEGGGEEKEGGSERLEEEGGEACAEGEGGNGGDHVRYGGEGADDTSELGQTADEKEAEKQLGREALLEEKRRGPHGLRFRRGNDAGGEGERERRREKGGEQRVDLLQLLLLVLQTQNHVH